MKRCNVCKIEKAPEAFHRMRSAKDGLQGKCRSCAAAFFAVWNEPRRAQRNESRRQWHRDNPDRIADRNARRRQRERGATMPFSDPVAIRAIYGLARRCRELGIAAHVDHVVPLKHPLVCGLHVAANLQPIDDTANLAKGNRSWPDMP